MWKWSIHETYVRGLSRAKVKMTGEKYRETCISLSVLYCDPCPTTHKYISQVSFTLRWHKILTCLQMNNDIRSAWFRVPSNWGERSAPCLVFKQHPTWHYWHQTFRSCKTTQLFWNVAQQLLMAVVLCPVKEHWRTRLSLPGYEEHNNCTRRDYLVSHA
jgi:hypothetical protein